MPVTNQQREQFISDIRNNNYSFIQNITGEQEEIIKYNQAHNSLINYLITEGRSYTDKILAIHRFNEQQRQLLISLYVNASRNVETAPTAKEKKQCLDLKAEIRTTLKTARRFNKWSSTILSRPTLQDQPSIISRDLSKTQPPLAMTYEKALQIEPVREEFFIKTGNGIPLHPRLQGEAFDPKHRAWGTLYPSIRKALQPVNDTWANKQFRNEDLTVEIEFNDELRQYDQNFNPSLNREVLDSDNPECFNSFNHYFSSKESLDLMLSTKEGCLYRGRGNNKINTGDYVRHIFIMDMQGNFYSNQDGEYRNGRRIGHPSFTQGEAVAGAGEIQIKAGKITHINNMSGHYLPGPLSLHRVINELENRGVLAPTCKVKINPPLGQSEGYFVGSVAEFKKAYPMPAEIQNAPDLSEKANPARLLDSLQAINDYLKHRATETNGFLALFKSFNGRDFYQRSNHFKQLIDIMQTQSRDQIVQHIDQTLAQFQQGRRTTYANLLSDLRHSLTNDSLLSNPLVNESLNNYSGVYDALNQHITAQRSYYKKSCFSNRSSERAEIASCSSQYKFFRKDISEDKRSEFVKADTLLEMTQRNAKNW
ncbi:MAG: hypothetical protein Q8M40_06130 [Legionella sp.]|nr:hypothetical protein [Legionella sp.]